MTYRDAGTAGVLTPFLRGRRFWSVNMTAWGLFVAAVATAIYAETLRRGGSVGWLSLTGRYAVYYLPWCLISPLVFWWVERHPLARQGWRRQGLWYLLFMGLWLAVYVPVESALASLLTYGNLTSIAEAFRAIPLNSWVLDSVFLLTLFGVANARDMTVQARSQERDTARLAIENAELSAHLSEAQLQILRAQLEPHFLFNALNAITGLIRTGEPETAARAVGLLSDLLRYATAAAAKPWVRFEDEVDFVDAYLGFQRLRHGQRLDCELEVDPAAAACWIPPLVLQPLLDNAIRHGVEQVDGASRVVLRAHRDNDALQLSVRNSPAASSETSGLGLGLENSRRRLQLMYGRSIELRHRTETSDASSGSTFVVEVTLPWRDAVP